MDTTTRSWRDQDLPRPQPRRGAAEDPRRARRGRHRDAPPRGSRGRHGGFFQRSYVEVDARAALADEQPLEARNDRATAEGLASPAIQALVEPGRPVRRRARARRGFGRRARPGRPARRRSRGGAPVDAGLYGPQPNRAAIEDVADGLDLDSRSPVARSRSGRRSARPVASAGLERAARRPHGRRRRAAARRRRPQRRSGRRPRRRGRRARAPFAQPRALKKLVRTALARRLPVMSDLGPGARTLAFVGAGGSGKSTATERLAVAYAEADADVVVVALRATDGGTGLASRLEPLGVSRDRRRRRRAGHAPARATATPRSRSSTPPRAGPADRKAVARSAADLRALGVSEVHLTLPATISAAAADELAAALAPIGITHVALTHADQTARPGAPVELAVRPAASFRTSAPRRDRAGRRRRVGEAAPAVIHYGRLDARPLHSVR